MKVAMFFVLAVSSFAPAAVPSIEPGIPGQIEVVSAFGTDWFPIFLFAGDTTFVEVRGGSHTDLDLYILNDRDQIVIRDTDETSHCIVRFTPWRTGVYYIKVVNLGARSNVYSLTIE